MEHEDDGDDSGSSAELQVSLKPTHSIRHISGIYVRNLTPFPQRDRVMLGLDSHALHASSQAAGGSGNTADDLDIILARKRTRRISGASVATFLSKRSDDLPAFSGSPDADSTLRANPGGRAQSTALSSSVPKASPSSAMGRSSSASGPRRGRSSSHSHSLLDQPSLLPSGSATVGSSVFTQTGLEQIISSRLFETFVTLSEVPKPSPPPAAPAPVHPSMRERTISSASRLRPLRERSSSPTPPRSPGAASTNGRPSSRASNASPSRPSSSASTVHPSPASKSQRPSSSTPKSRLRSYTSSDSIPRTTPSSSPRLPPSGSTKSPLHTPSNPSPKASSATVPEVYVPFYISPSHPPSTNPHWSDIKPFEDFVPDVDVSSRVVKVTLWARRRNGGAPLSSSRISSELEPALQQHRHAPHLGHQAVDAKGKGKASESMNVHVDNDGGKASPGWKILTTWDVDLDKLQPFAPDFASTSEDLPPNSIVLSLNPSGNLFVSPPPSDPLGLETGSRSSSPEHNVSDGEVDTASRPRGRTRRGTLVRFQKKRDDEAAREVQRRSMRETRMKKGPALDVTKRLLQLHAQIDDVQSSLQDLVANIDALVEPDSLLGLQRHANQAQETLSRLQEEKDRTLLACQQDRDALAERRIRLEERRDHLHAAMHFHDDEIADLDTLQDEIDSEQQHVKESRSTLATSQARLVRTLERIYPIEPISAGDLLFGILSIPLPIPINPSDPAPPLSHPDWPSVNEENIATALGYSAQVVLALSVYLNVVVPYPIVCAGSRSVVKDPISHMHGPRTFPLYSKGVDTYRFEYAVFLLNKDIEMLMSQCGVQVLDMRHTLPNLKNLLLTVTNGLGDEDDEDKAIKSSFTIPDAKSSPTPTETTLHPTDSAAHTEDRPSESDGGPTPTNTVTARKPKPFFDTITISNFWHLRAPSLGSPRQTSGSGLSSVAVEPSLPTTPELTDAEDSAELSGESTVETVETEEALPGDGDEFPTSPTVGNGESTLANTEDDGDDSETIKDGSNGKLSNSTQSLTSPTASSTATPSVAKSAPAPSPHPHPPSQPSGWLSRAFFGQQIDRDRELRDREKAHPSGRNAKRKAGAPTIPPAQKSSATANGITNPAAFFAGPTGSANEETPSDGRAASGSTPAVSAR